MEVGFDTNFSGQSGDSEESFTYVPGAEDVRLPFVRLAQGLTPEVVDGLAKPGQWIMPDGSLTDVVACVVMGMRKTRALKGEGTEIVCRSKDGITGEGNPGGECDGCPLAEWSGTKDHRVPPKCTMSYQYLVEYGNEERSGLGVISMSTKSASRAAAQVNMHVRMYGFNGFRMTLGSAFVNKGMRKYHIPTIVSIAPLRQQIEAKDEQGPA
jgi:hypothetical protein